MISFTELVTAVQNMRNLLAKGRGHKYIKRIPVGQTPSGGIKYRYIYNATSTVGGKNLLDEAHLKVGTKLMLHSEDGAEVHAHITEVKGDKVTFVYDDGDRKGEEKTLTKQKLLGDFNQEHDVKGQLSAAKEKLLADIESAVAGGTISEKQLARLVERLESLGGQMTGTQQVTPLDKPFTDAQEKAVSDTLGDYGEYVIEVENYLASRGLTLSDVKEDMRTVIDNDKFAKTGRFELRDGTTITVEGSMRDELRTVTIETPQGDKAVFTAPHYRHNISRQFAENALLHFASGHRDGGLPPTDLKDYTGDLKEVQGVVKLSDLGMIEQGVAQSPVKKELEYTAHTKKARKALQDVHVNDWQLGDISAIVSGTGSAGVGSRTPFVHGENIMARSPSHVMLIPTTLEDGTTLEVDSVSTIKANYKVITKLDEYLDAAKSYPSKLNLTRESAQQLVQASKILKNEDRVDIEFRGDVAVFSKNGVDLLSVPHEGARDSMSVSARDLGIAAGVTSGGVSINVPSSRQQPIVIETSISTHLLVPLRPQS